MTYAENREVDGFLDGSEKKLEEDASVDEKKRWKKGDSTTRIQFCIDYNQMQLDNVQHGSRNVGEAKTEIQERVIKSHIQAQPRVP